MMMSPLTACDSCVSDFDTTSSNLFILSTSCLRNVTRADWYNFWDRCSIEKKYKNGVQAVYDILTEL